MKKIILKWNHGKCLKHINVISVNYWRFLSIKDRIKGYEILEFYTHNKLVNNTEIMKMIQEERYIIL